MLARVSDIVQTTKEQIGEVQRLQQREFKNRQIKQRSGSLYQQLRLPRFDLNGDPTLMTTSPCPEALRGLSNFLQRQPPGDPEVFRETEKALIIIPVYSKLD